MSVKKRRIISCLVTFILTVSLLWVSSVILEPDGIVRCAVNVEAFHMLPENSCELLIIGSSHSWRSMDPARLYENTGIGSYNYSVDSLQLGTTALFFFDALRTQKPKVVMIETYRVDEPVIDSELTSEIYHTRPISDFPYKRTYLSRVFGNHPLRYLDYYCPLTLFHSRWDNLKKSHFSSAYRPSQYLDTMGYCSAPYAYDIWPVEIEDPLLHKQVRLRDESLMILDEITETCKAEGIELVYFTVPFAQRYGCVTAMTEYAEKNDCYYFNGFDYMDEMGLDPATDFADKSHVNDSGAEKFTRYMGTWLTEHFDFEDMRLTENNLWEGKVGNKVGIK